MRRARNGSQRSRLGPHIVPYSMVRSAQVEGAAPAAAGDQEPIVRTPRPAVSTFSPTAAHLRKAQVPLGPGSLSSGSSSKGTRQLIIHSPRRSIPSVLEEIQAAHAFISTGVPSKRSKLQQDTSNEKEQRRTGLRTAAGRKVQFLSVFSPKCMPNRFGIRREAHQNVSPACADQCPECQAYPTRIDSR